MPTVFVSSTSRDLKEHREAARDALLDLGLHPIMMENFGAMDADAVEGCRQKLLESDVFVGIYAHRYGYIPAGSTISITEMEYDWAVEAGKPRYVFVIAPRDPSITSRDESSEAAQKLTAFYQRVGTDLIWKEFTTPDSLKAAVAASLAHEAQAAPLPPVESTPTDRRRLTGLLTIMALLLIGIIGTIALTNYRREQREDSRIGQTADASTQTMVAARNATTTATLWTATPTITPTAMPSATPLPTATPLVAAAGLSDETLIVIAKFEQQSDTPLEISFRDEIESAAQDVPGVRVINIDHTITGVDSATQRAEAQRVLDAYNATLVIYGYVVEGGGVSVSYEVTARRSYLDTEIEGQFRVSAGEVGNLELYLFEAADAPYVVGLTTGQLFLFEEEYEDALEAFNLAVDRIPAGREYEMAAPKLYYFRGNTHFALNNYEAALADYNQTIRLDDTFAFAYNNRGVIYQYGNDYEAAFADYSLAIELDPSYALAYFNRGIIHYNQGNYEAALIDYSLAIELDPVYVNAYISRGIIHYNQGNYEAALTDYSLAIELDPSYALAYFNRGLVYERTDELARAGADYWRSIQLKQYHKRTAEFTDQTLKLVLDRVFMIPFEAQTGDQFTTDVTARTESIDPLLIVLDAAGNPLFGRDDYASDNYNTGVTDFILPDTGSYTLVITHSSGGANGSVDVTVALQSNE